MNSNQLRYFSVVYEKRSLSAAAKAIPMSHQGLAKALDKLESELGVVLFNTVGHSLSPTRYADSLYDFGQECAQLHQKMCNEFAKIDALTKGELHLGASTGVFGFLGEGFVKGFLAANPGIKIVELELPDLLCDDTLENGSFDLALTVYPFDDRFSTMEMYRCDRCVWVSVADPLASRESLTFKDLQGYTLATMGPSFKNYTDLTSILEREGIEPTSIECAAEMLWLYKHAGQAGRATFTVPHIVEFFRDNHSIVGKTIIGIPWGFGISWRKGHTLSESERLFVDYCLLYSKNHIHSTQKKTESRIWL